MIKIEGLKKRFGELTAVDGLNFDILRNEIFGLLGPNGAGKTTTISMICGLLSPSEGQIIFEESSAKDRKSLIGYCPQDNIYYPRLTCIEQLLFIGHMYELSSKYVRSRAEEILDLLGLKGKSHVLASNLSGGMKRRLNICLALIHDPEILILDEPEAGLDPQSRIMVRDFIKAFARKKTVVLTTHNMDEADRMADRVAIIDHGKLLMIDTPQKLKSSVGEGDILELVLENGNEAALSRFAGNVSSLSLNVKISSGSVLIKYSNIVEHLPAIKDMAESAGLNVSEIKLRENTLEDVFIHLTGRNLRQ
ncbi:MAG: ABC transporter ATP-binding protein [Bacteroidales bacterium]|nr:ABC transporter ATP-binding protein [Bacteroidales bacterium]